MRLPCIEFLQIQIHQICVHMFLAFTWHQDAVWGCFGKGSMSSQLLQKFLLFVISFCSVKTSDNYNSRKKWTPSHKVTVFCFSSKDFTLHGPYVHQHVLVFLHILTVWLATYIKCCSSLVTSKTGKHSLTPVFQTFVKWVKENAWNTLMFKYSSPRAHWLWKHLIKRFQVMVPCLSHSQQNL